MSMVPLRHTRTLFRLNPFFIGAAMLIGVPWAAAQQRTEVYAELTSALYAKPQAPPIIASFIGGLGGRDISAEEFYEIAAEMRKAVANGVTPAPRLLYSRDELRELRKLQAVAHAERNELEPGS